jgi:hypothetical protein
VRLTGCRVAFVAWLILGIIVLLGAQAGPLTEPPAMSLLKIVGLGASPKPPVQFSHKLHEAWRVS